MAKDIKVLKGGYGAEYGERVGGIVDITGIGRQPVITIGTIVHKQYDPKWID